MTIYDIAKEAGVSPSTVSRVVNNKTGIRPSTRKKVLELLTKYNYSPNETARGLVNKASKIIGILIADIRNIHHTDGAYVIERELVKLGYCCILFNTGTDDFSKAEYISILSQRRVEGAVLIGSTFQTEEVATAIEKYLANVPIVITNGYLNLPNVYGVMADEMNGVYNCVKLLFSKGKKNLAFVIDNYTMSNKLKRNGFKQALKDEGIEQEAWVYKTQSTSDSLYEEEAYEVTKKIMIEHPELDGIIYAVDLLAVCGMRALTDMGIKIPEQVAIMGIDNSVYARICTPRLSSLDNKLVDLSTAAVRNLIEALQGRPVAKKMLIFSEINEREST